jgi:kynurenine formamidase
MTDALLDVIRSGVRVVDLAQSLENGIPCSPNHPGFKLAMLRRHGDAVRADDTSAANELIVTGGHVGTHIDALGHFSAHGKLFGAVDAAEAQRGGRLATRGVDELAPIVAPGVLIDVAAARGTDVVPAGDAVTPEDLEAALAAEGIALEPGAVALVRTGWARNWSDPIAFIGHDSGVPGPNEPAARWLLERGVVAVGSDTTAFEHVPPGQGHALLPVHRLLLVEHGVPIIEMLNLEQLAELRIYRFCVIVSPLRIVGGTGSPCRPLAVCSR